MNRTSSLRRTAAPIPVAPMASSRRVRFGVLLLGRLLRRRRAASHGAGAGRDRLDDVVIAGAAAQIAVELVADGLLVELVALAAHDVERRHDHAGGAEAALQPVILAEGFLHGMELVAV